jgi:large subunit ribosomal protein L21
MLVVFKTGGKQYSVKAGEILKVEKLKGAKGDRITFNDVLAVCDSSSYTIGNPFVKGANVQAKILDQIRDKKIIVFKKRERQNYRHTQGHRQYLTVLKIESVDIGDKRITSSEKKLSAVKAPLKKETKITKTESKKRATPKKKIKKSVALKKTAVKKKAAAKKGADK